MKDRHCQETAWGALCKPPGQTPSLESHTVLQIMIEQWQMQQGHEAKCEMSISSPSLTQPTGDFFSFCLRHREASNFHFVPEMISNESGDGLRFLVNSFDARNEKEIELHGNLISLLCILYPDYEKMKV